MKKNKEKKLSSNNFRTLLKHLKAHPIIQRHLNWTDNLTNDLYNEFINMFSKQVAYKIDVEKYDNFEISTNVYRVGSNICLFLFSPKYLGVRSITTVYSDYVEVEMYKHKIEFMEMTPKNNAIYVPKSQSKQNN